MAMVAGVDSSTQSTKVQIRDLDTGEVLGLAAAPHPSTTPPRSEQDPAAWWEAFQICWAQLGSPQVAAISVAGQQHGMVVLDADRQVIRPAKLWNDTESAADAGWLRKQLDGGAPQWAAAVGSVPVASFTVTKLSWLHRSEPETWARVAHVLLPHDWLTLQLTGELVTDRGDASGTGYWSPATGKYRDDILAIVDRDRDWRSVVPTVAAPTAAVGHWNGAVVACGTGDNMAAALGLGLGAGAAAMSIGTSGVVSAVSEQPVADPSGTVAGFADATGRYLPLICTLNAAKVLDAVARLLGVDVAALSDLAAGVASAGGLTLLPYFDGERTPDLPASRGWLSGITSDVGRGQLARAAVDGVACGLLDGLDALAEFVPIERVVLTGGAARSDALAGVLAGLADRPVTRSDQQEAVAAGACVQAAATLRGTSAGEVIERWGLGASSTVAVLEGGDGVRQNYAELRHQAYPG